MKIKLNGLHLVFYPTFFQTIFLIMTSITSYQATASFPELGPQLSNNQSLINKTFVLEIERFESTLTHIVKPDLIVQQFSQNNTYLEERIYQQTKPTLSSLYRLNKHQNNQLGMIIENWVERSSLTIEYTFNRNNGGIWSAKLPDEQLFMSGHFIMSNSQLSEEQHLAEASHNNLTVAVNITEAKSKTVPTEAFPERAVVMQSYFENGTYKAIGFGPKSIPHHGTYTYEKVSANVAIERTTQMMANLAAPFIMIYFYDTPTSGRFFQNFGNGNIYFAGIFSTFETGKDK